MFSFATFSSFRFITCGVPAMLTNASSRGTPETPSSILEAETLLVGELGLAATAAKMPVFPRRLCRGKSPENSPETARFNARTLSRGGGQVIILGQMCPPAVMPSEAGRPTTKREHMPALPSAAGPDMCYFLLARPTCATEPFRRTPTCCHRMRTERDLCLRDKPF